MRHSLQQCLVAVRYFDRLTREPDRPFLSSAEGAGVLRRGDVEVHLFGPLKPTEAIEFLQEHADGATISVGISTSAAQSAEASAANLAVAAHPGQVLSDFKFANHIQVCSEFRGSVSSLGEHILDDDFPLFEVFQIDLGSESTRFPPIRAIPAPKNNLVPRTAPFFGRWREIDALEDLLAGERLVTLTGTPGIGKSSLAWRVGVELTREFPGGVWLLRINRDMTSIAIQSELLGLLSPEKRHLDSMAEIVEGIDPTLVILDGCETSLSECRMATETMLISSDSIKVLCASRQRLGIAQEVVFPIGPMDGGRLDDLQHDESPIEPDAVRFLLDRILQRVPGYRVTARGLEDLRAVCQILEGNPGLLNLASSAYLRGGMEAIQALAASAMSLEPAGSHFSESAVRTAVDSLSDRARQALLTISVFVGEWGRVDFEHATEVGEEEDSASLLRELSEAGLLELHFQHNGSIRFHCPDLISSAVRSWDTYKSGSNKAKRLHAEHYLEIAESCASDLPTARSGEAMDRLEACLPNIRIAISRANLGQFEKDHALRFIIAMAGYWHRRGPYREALDLCHRAVSLEGEVDKKLESRAWNILGTFQYTVGELAKAVEAHRRAFNIALETDDLMLVGMAVANIALSLMQQGNFEEASAAGREGVDVFRKLGDQRRLAGSLTNLGSIYEELKCFGPAEECFIEAVHLFEQMGDPWAVTRVRLNLADMALSQERFRMARSRYLVGFASCVERSDPRSAVFSLEGLAIAEQKVGDPLLSATALGLAKRIRQDSGTSCLQTWSERLRTLEGELEDSIGRERLESQFQTAALLDLEEAYQLLSKTA